MLLAWLGLEEIFWSSCAKSGHSSDTMLLAPCWASGAEPPMVVRVVTGIARTGSVRSVWERSA